MKTDVLIKELNIKLNEFWLQNQDILTIKNRIFYNDYLSVRIALNLVELAFVSGRKINENEEIWFKGKRYIDDSFGSTQEWYEIFILYSQLIDYVDNNNFFRED